MHLARAVPWLYPLARIGLFCVPLAVLIGDLFVAVFFIVIYTLAWGIEAYYTGVASRDIIYLRAFGDAASNTSYYRRLGPILGCFGRPLTVATHSNIAMYPLDSVAAFLTRRQNRFGEVELSEGEWRREILGVLRMAWLVVGDMSTRTDNVLWELRAAIQLVGKDRILFLLSSHPQSVGPEFSGVTWLSHSSPTLERDLAAWLEERIGPPGWIKRRALTTFLKDGRCVRYVVWMSIYVLTKMLRLGSVRSRNRHAEGPARSNR